MSRPDQGIRVKALAVLPALDRRRHLVWRGVDPTTGREFHRLLGGHVEQGERSVDAVVREIAEETGRTLRDPRLLGVLESRFDFDGAPGHEIVFVYAGLVEGPAPDDLIGVEGGWLADNGVPIRVEWRPLADADVALPLYPDGVGDLLPAAGMLEP